MKSAAEVKFLEIRDSMTFIPAMAVLLSQRDVESVAGRWLLSRAGLVSHSHRWVMLTKLETDETHCCYSTWSNRTMEIAHKFIRDNWDSILDGEVIDVEHILGITEEKKSSERLLNL